MFDDLFLQDFVAESKLVYAINEVLLADEPAAASAACADDWCPPDLGVFNYFLKTEDLIVAQ